MRSHKAQRLILIVMRMLRMFVVTCGVLVFILAAGLALSDALPLSESEVAQWMPTTFLKTTQSKKYAQSRVVAADDFLTVSEIESHYGLQVIVADDVWSQEEIVELFNQTQVALGRDVLGRLLSEYQLEGYSVSFVFDTTDDWEDALITVDDSVRLVHYDKESPHETLMHEIGHLLEFLHEMRGDNLRVAFASRNGDLGYMGNEWFSLKGVPDGHDRTFVSAYAMSEASEDFAETFSFAFRYPDHLYDGCEYDPRIISASEDQTSPLAQKIEFVHGISLF